MKILDFCKRQYEIGQFVKYSVGLGHTLESRIGKIVKFNKNSISVIYGFYGWKTNKDGSKKFALAKGTSAIYRFSEAIIIHEDNLTDEMKLAFKNT